MTEARDAATLTGIAHHARSGRIRRLSSTTDTFIGGTSTVQYTQIKTRLKSWRGRDKRAEVAQRTKRYTLQYLSSTVQPGKEYCTVLWRESRPRVSGRFGNQPPTMVDPFRRIISNEHQLAREKASSRNTIEGFNVSSPNITS